MLIFTSLCLQSSYKYYLQSTFTDSGHEILLPLLFSRSENVRHLCLQRKQPEKINAIYSFICVCYFVLQVGRLNTLSTSNVYVSITLHVKATGNASLCYCSLVLTYFNTFFQSNATQ